MTRENAYDKGRRYLCEGRVIVRRVDETGIEATVRGTGELYKVAWSRSAHWRCNCQSVAWCSHMYAVALCTVRPDGRP